MSNPLNKEMLIAGGFNDASNEHSGVATPEAFGAIGNGHVANAAADTAGLQAAINTGLPVQLRGGAVYYLNAPLRPAPGKHLMIRGTYNTGDARTVIIATSGFTGWMLNPTGGYDIRDVRLMGNGKDGCYCIGSNDNSSAGLARIERTYISDADIGIFFDAEWEHPWGVYYNQIVGVTFRTGGINLGGVTGEASSGESAWSMDNITMIGSSLAGSTGTGGIAAPSQVVTVNTPNSTSDTISWDNTTIPLYGWCVMRSADGSTGWHIVPNWTSSNYQSGSFVATKTAGETWQYKVVRMTRGLSIRRGKSISIGVAQLEYFGIGVYFEGVFSARLDQYYGETRDRPIPLPAYTGIMAHTSNISCGGGWSEQFGYGVVSHSNSQVVIDGPWRSNNCKWGKAALGGSTNQRIIYNSIIASGTTPDTVVSLSGTGGIYEKNIDGGDFVGGGMRRIVDGSDNASLIVRRRGTDVAKLFSNASGEGELSTNRATITLPNKTLRMPLINIDNRTVMTIGTATNFLTIANVPTNSATELSFDYMLRMRDGSSVIWQVVSGRLHVAISESAGSGVAAALSTSTPAKAIKQGTISSDPVFSASVTDNIVTISCLVTSSQSLADIYLVPVGGIGRVNDLVITML